MLNMQANIASGITKSISISFENFVKYPVAIQNNKVDTMISAIISQTLDMKSRNTTPTPLYL